MAVKKHELGQDPRPLDLTALVGYLQHLNDHTHYLPPDNLITNCQDIVKCLARAHGSYYAMVDDLRDVEEYLLRAITAAPADIRHEIITALLDQFHQYISDPQCNANAAISVVLVVLEADPDAAQSTARWLVQQGEGPEGVGLRAALSCLYTWMVQWNGSPSLGSWIMAFIKALEENERFDILIDVGVENLGHLFSTMDDPGSIRQTSADLICHLLSSLRESKEAIDVIAPHVSRVLTHLASDSGQFSRQLLQNVVDILKEMMENVGGENNNDTTPNKYNDMMQCLERHMASRGCRFLQLPPWKARSVCGKAIKTSQPLRKVGLLNLGNTCYMNSVIQALMLTRQFSTHVMLQMNSAAYWSKMSVLFAKMMHSITNRLDPGEFFKVFRPPFFTINSQHDSSEFLGYLFELLATFEHSSDLNFDYSKPGLRNPSQMNAYRLRSATSQSTSSAADFEAPEPGPNRRSMSPRPGGSGSGSSTSPNKRTAKADGMSMKKRSRIVEPFLRRDSIIDSMFGGVLLTRVECSECHTSFLSRDVFRDLQLAFPDKPEGYKHSVQTLLEYYCSEERLTGDNKYKCPECGVLRDAERSVLVETTPKYLILVLKNFKFEPKHNVQTKLMHKMCHNNTITLPTVRSQANHSSYVMYAAVVHRGTTLDSGHYYTIGKDNGGWYLYNDDKVTVTNEAEINKLSACCTPYVLFYRRTDVEEGPAPSLNELPPKLQEQVMSHNKEIVDNARVLQHRISCP